MDKLRTSKWWFIVLPGLAMWLGWGLRGQMGHADGAMIPGALVALALCCLLREKRFSRGLAIGLTAVAFGFGAEMTTLESAGLVMGSFHHPVQGTVALGYAGLAIKGALWALFGGAALGLAFAASRYRRRDIVLLAIFMVVSYYVGWALINRPKLLYFSVTRHESWGGFLFAAIVMLVWLTMRGHTRIPLILAICAAIAGGIGYPVAVTLAGIGVHSSFVGRWYDWWKVAETTFGAFMGVGLGIGTYLVRDKLPETEEVLEPSAKPGVPVWGVILGLVIAGVTTAVYFHGIPWIILGSILLVIAFCSFKAAWHIGVTLTYCAIAVNVLLYWRHEQRIGNAALLWTLLVLTTIFVSWKVVTWWRESDPGMPGNAFVFVMWALLILEYLKMFIDRAVLNPSAQSLAAAGGRWSYTLDTWGHQFVTNIFFTVAAVVLTWLAYRSSRLRAAPEAKASLRSSEALT